MLRAEEFAHRHADRFRHELHELLRMPSVSTDAEKAADMDRAAGWLAQHLGRIGLSAEVVKTELHPIVFGQWLGAGAAAPTVLIYGHYDVLPAARADGWETDPFDPVERDGKIWGRGASDDKGQLFAHIKAIESILETNGKLPLNVKLIIEGEEERGSPSMSRFISDNIDRLRADVCLISDAQMRSVDKPSIITSVRGVCVARLEVRGPDHDLHSGEYGGTVHNPAQALTEIVGKLHEAGGMVSVPGFYDRVVLPSEADRESLAGIPWTLSQWRRETGAPRPWGETDYTLRERATLRPTVEIVAVGSGSGGATTAVIPAKAWAVLICRLVPEQEPQEIHRRLKAYVAALTPSTIQSELSYVGGALPAAVDLDTPYVGAATRAFERGWKAKPIFVRGGGSIPAFAELQAVLELPVLMTAYGLVGDNPHGTNEHISIEMFHRGIDTTIAFLEEASEVGTHLEDGR